jgi:hypothetical protein
LPTVIFLGDKKNLTFETAAGTMLMFHEGLTDAVRIVNFIKTSLLNLCARNFMFGDGSRHPHLLLHTEVCWLPRCFVLC